MAELKGLEELRQQKNLSSNAGKLPNRQAVTTAKTTVAKTTVAKTTVAKPTAAVDTAATAYSKPTLTINSTSEKQAKTTFRVPRDIHNEFKRKIIPYSITEVLAAFVRGVAEGEYDIEEFKKKIIPYSITEVLAAFVRGVAEGKYDIEEIVNG